jgi:hypothetical protein
MIKQFPLFDRALGSETLTKEINPMGRKAKNTTEATNTNPTTPEGEAAAPVTGSTGTGTRKRGRKAMHPLVAEQIAKVKEEQARVKEIKALVKLTSGVATMGSFSLTKLQEAIDQRRAELPVEGAPKPD